MYVTELLSWQAKDKVTDQAMVLAVEAMLDDLRSLPGFLFQNLSKDSQGNWFEVYFWRTAEDAHQSNERMANKASLQQLMQLIKPESLKMEVMTPLQDSGFFL